MTARALILPDFDGAREFRRWALAAAIVCAVHFGLMAGYLLLPTPEAEGAAYAPAIIIDLAPAPAPVAPSSPDDIAPGPDMLYILGRTSSQGWRGGFVATLGIGAGCFVHIGAAALGLSALLTTSAPRLGLNQSTPTSSRSPTMTMPAGLVAAARPS